MRLVWLVLVLVSVLPSSAAAQADYVLHNARIYTADLDHPTAQAMAVRGDRILMVGSDRQVFEAYPNASATNLNGQTVTPGLIDAHVHLIDQGLAMLKADLVGARSIDEVVERLKRFETQLPDDAWLTGRGWDQNDWPGAEYPTRGDLDAAFPDRPVWLERIDGHAAWANTAAMQSVGLERIDEAADPEGGQIMRDMLGQPTGIFIDTATRLIDQKVPPPAAAERRQALQLVLDATARHGLTSVHDAGISTDDLRAYEEAIERDAFPIRVYAMIGGMGPLFEQVCESGPITEPSGRLSVRSVKMYVDGALGSRGAALLEPYADDPGNEGLLRITPDAFTDRVRSAMRCGLQVNTHAIGDRGNRVVLDAYEAALESLGRTIGRHRIEHAQIVHSDDIPRFAELGIIASMQPTHATSDMYWAEDRLGEARLDGAYAWRSFMDEGVRLTFGSDFPVEAVNPLLGFYAAVTRSDADGWPSDGWQREERVDRMEALRAFTIDAAYAAFQDDEIGSLEPGKRADFVVLSHDIMTIPAVEILHTKVVATYLDGERIYDAASESNQRH